MTDPYRYNVPEFARQLVVRLHLDRNKRKEREEQKGNRNHIVRARRVAQAWSLCVLFSACCVGPYMLFCWERCEGFKSSGVRRTSHCKHLLKNISLSCVSLQSLSFAVRPEAEHSIAGRIRYRSLPDAPLLVSGSSLINALPNCSVSGGELHRRPTAICSQLQWPLSNAASQVCTFTMITAPGLCLWSSSHA